MDSILKRDDGDGFKPIAHIKDPQIHDDFLCGQLKEVIQLFYDRQNIKIKKIDVQLRDHVTASESRHVIAEVILRDGNL
jgi:hypothetical protein